MIRFLQINLGRGQQAQDLLMQVSVERSIDILLITEQYKKRDGWFEGATNRSAIAVRSSNINIGEANESAANFVWVNIQGLRVYSCYLSPTDTFDEFQRDLDELEESIRTAQGEVIVTGDLNSKSPEWGSRILDKRGEALSEMIARLDMVILNEGTKNTFERGTRGSVVDVTFSTTRIASDARWTVLDQETLSDHKYIEFTIEDTHKRFRPEQSQNARKWIVKRLDREKLAKILENAKKRQELPTQGVDKMADFVVDTVTAACESTMPRYRANGSQKKNRLLVDRRNCGLQKKLHRCS